MKKFVLSILILSLISCGGGSVGSDDEKGFVHTPDSLEKKTVPSDVGEDYDVDFVANQTGNYAIIYKCDIDETSYVGIAISDDPSSETFNMKIYFPSDTIDYDPTFDENSTTSRFRIVDSDGTYEFGYGNGTGGNVTITVILENETDDYTTYRITASTTITLDKIIGAGPATKILDLTPGKYIIALYVGG